MIDSLGVIFLEWGRYVLNFFIGIYDIIMTAIILLYHMYKRRLLFCACEFWQAMRRCWRHRRLTYWLHLLAFYILTFSLIGHVCSIASLAMNWRATKQRRRVPSAGHRRTATLLLSSSPTTACVELRRRSIARPSTTPSDRVPPRPSTPSRQTAGPHLRRSRSSPPPPPTKTTTNWDCWRLSISESTMCRVVCRCMWMAQRRRCARRKKLSSSSSSSSSERQPFRLCFATKYDLQLLSYQQTKNLWHFSCGAGETFP